MGINEDIGRAADEIIDRVADAVKNGNYEHLSSDINQSVQRSKRNISERRNTDNINVSSSGQIGQCYNPYMSGTSRPKTMEQVREAKEHRTAFMGSVSLDNRFGSSVKLAAYTVLVVFNSFMAMIFAILAITSGVSGDSTTCIVMIVMLGVFGGLDGIFIHFRRSTKRNQTVNALFKKYQQIIGTREYFAIDDLCVKTGQSYEIVVGELENMMNAGIMPGSSFDNNKRTILLSDYARAQYNALMQDVMARQEADNRLPHEAIEILKKGDEYIARIHRANDLIPEESMSGKLDDLENIMKKIFGEVRRSPEKRNDLRKLMDYYLPTTLKLVEAYADMENQPDTENITSMKKEIENSLDVINEVCRNIFDAMFDDENWDITSDINVMKSMMQQDGLVHDDSTLKSAD